MKKNTILTVDCPADYGKENELNELDEKLDKLKHEKEVEVTKNLYDPYTFF